MISLKSVAAALGITTAVITGHAQAISLQDTLSSAVGQLGQSNNATATTPTPTNNPSSNALLGLLNGGDQTLNASNMNNAAGVLQYCMKQKLVSATGTENIKNQLLGKLGLDTQQEQQQQADYTQGVMGILNTSNGQQLNLDSFKNTPLAKKARAKACNIILKQGANFIN